MAYRSCRCLHRYRYYHYDKSNDYNNQSWHDDYACYHHNDIGRHHHYAQAR